MTGWTARYTAPNPPTPIFPSIRYSPTTLPGARSLSTAANVSSGTRAAPSFTQVVASPAYFSRQLGQIAIPDPLTPSSSARQQGSHPGRGPCKPGVNRASPDVQPL